jgi:hypothetical protein
MGTGELTSEGGGKTCWRLGGGVADTRDLVVAGDGTGEGTMVSGGGGAIGSIHTPLDGRGYGAKRDSSTILL